MRCLNVPMRVDGGGISNGVVNVGLRVMGSLRPGRLSDLEDESIIS
jgi:hypothetical protein